MILRAILSATCVMSSCAAVELPPVIACCPAFRDGQSVINADQTVIIIWDPVSKMEHFIRQASFKTDTNDFGFLVPTPAQPELDESGNDAFPYLKKLTEPEVITKWQSNMGCGGEKYVTTYPKGTTQPEVRILDEKMVAGFHAVVLEASSAGALAKWLAEKGFVLSKEIEAWAQPYVDGNWKFTALKVAKESRDRTGNVAAGALRLSFRTDRPLFPYREPDYKNAARGQFRTLRIYFIGESRYDGDIVDQAWTGKSVWSNKLDAFNRKQILGTLKLPEASVPAQFWLTEFEDNWPDAVATGDLYFSRDANQQILKRPPIIHYATIPIVEGTCVLFAIAFITVVIWRIRKRRAAQS